MTTPRRTVYQTDAVSLLDSLDARSVDAIITSPPYIGLPGRGDTIDLVGSVLERADRILTENGVVALIVGPSPGHMLLPLEVAQIIGTRSNYLLQLHSMYVWDRTGSLQRNVGTQHVSHDFVLVIERTSDSPTSKSPPELVPGSVIRSPGSGFDYGLGVTTPPDLAQLLVGGLTNPGNLIVDPFCGLAEIGVQAVRAWRSFIGGDIDLACVEIANRRLGV